MSSINIAPLNFSNEALLEKIMERLSEMFEWNVKRINLDLNPQASLNKERNQYYSTQIIADAIKITDDIAGKIVLLCDFDLFVPVFTFIFGEAQLNGKHSTVSLCRLHEEFYSGVTNDELLFERAVKEILHELGHTFGLIHCKNWDCVMRPSLTVEEIDIKGSGFCSSCSSAIPLKGNILH
jgi:archaemetzincin